MNLLNLNGFSANIHIHWQKMKPELNSGILFLHTVYALSAYI